MLILTVYVVFMSFGDGEISRNQSFINVSSLDRVWEGQYVMMEVWGKIRSEIAMEFHA